MPEPTKPSAERMLDEMSDDALAEMAHEFAEEAKRLSRLAHGAYAELQARMVERKAKKLETEHWSGVMRPGLIRHSVDDPDRLRQRLVPHVDTEALVAAFIEPAPPPLRPDHRFLNDLHKRGGVIAQIIDEERQSVRSEDVLVLERKPTVDEERAMQEERKA